MRKLAILAAGGCFLTGPAVAQAISQYYSTSMSCDQVRATIRAEGIAIMRYQSLNNPSLTRYDRYVANAHLCPIGQIEDDAYIPASDTAYCKVKRCIPKVFKRPFSR